MLIIVSSTCLNMFQRIEIIFYLFLKYLSWNLNFWIRKNFKIIQKILKIFRIFQIFLLMLQTGGIATLNFFILVDAYLFSICSLRNYKKFYLSFFIWKHNYLTFRFISYYQRSNFFIKVSSPTIKYRILELLCRNYFFKG